MLSQLSVRIESLERRMFLSTGSPDQEGWMIDDNVQLAAGQYASARHVITDDVGNVFAAGEADTPTGRHLLIREKAAGTDTWTTITDMTGYSQWDGLYAYRDPATGVESFVACALPVGNTNQWVVMKGPIGGPMQIVDQLPSSSHARDIAGSGSEIYVTGQSTDVRGYSHLIVRRSLSGGDSGTWQPVLDYQYARTTNTSGGSITISPSGVYVAGNYGSPAHWLTLASPTGGSGTWDVVDNYQFDPTGASAPTSISADSNGNIFVTGAGTEVTSSTVIVKKKPVTTYTTTGWWLTRKGTVTTGSSGTTVAWSTVDQFRLPDSKANASVSAQAFATDALGNKYVVGSVQDATAYHWVVRRSSTGDPDSWTTINDWQWSPGQLSCALGIAIDASNNIYVSGNAADSAGVRHWIVKELPAAGSTLATQAPAAATAGPARKVSPFSTRSILFKKHPTARVHAKGVHAH